MKELFATVHEALASPLIGPTEKKEILNRCKMDEVEWIGLLSIRAGR